jgi:hypothetical protein
MGAQARRDKMAAGEYIPATSRLTEYATPTVPSIHNAGSERGSMAQLRALFAEFADDVFIKAILLCGINTGSEQRLSECRLHHP